MKSRFASRIVVGIVSALFLVPSLSSAATTAYEPAYQDGFESTTCYDPTGGGCSATSSKNPFTGALNGSASVTTRLGNRAPTYGYASSAASIFHSHTLAAPSDAVTITARVHVNSASIVGPLLPVRGYLGFSMINLTLVAQHMEGCSCDATQTIELLSSFEGPTSLGDGDFDIVATLVNGFEDQVPAGLIAITAGLEGRVELHGARGATSAAFDAVVTSLIVES